MGRRERELTVLVTGVGAPVAVSVFKALRQATMKLRIVGTDANPLSVGLYRADKAYVLPRVTIDEDTYRDRLAEICRAENVAMVCFGSEIEMRRVAPHLDDFERQSGARLILNAPAILETFMDKWETVSLLKAKGLPVPDSVLTTDPAALKAFLSRHTFPLILKPRHSSGSKNVFFVHSVRELEFFSRYVLEPVVQEYLLPDDEEYTVGVYKSRRFGYVGQIVLRRVISAGVTYKAEVVRDEGIESVCRAVVESFDVWGPINVQLRKTADGVRIFEINLRFSSSAVMRAHFGFNEPDMCVRDVVLEERPPRPVIRAGSVLRYWDEVYLEPGTYPADSTIPHDFKRTGAKADSF